MTYDPANWAPPVRVSSLVIHYTELDICLRCSAVVLIPEHDPDANRARHDHWHDELAHHIARTTT